MEPSKYWPEKRRAWKVLCDRHLLPVSTFPVMLVYAMPRSACGRSVLPAETATALRVPRPHDRHGKSAIEDVRSAHPACGSSRSPRRRVTPQTVQKRRALPVANSTISARNAKKAPGLFSKPENKTRHLGKTLNPLIQDSRLAYLLMERSSAHLKSPGSSGSVKGQSIGSELI